MKTKYLKIWLSKSNRKQQNITIKGLNLKGVACFRWNDEYKLEIGVTSQKNCFSPNRLEKNETYNLQNSNQTC